MSTYRIGLLARLEGPYEKGPKENNFTGKGPYLSRRIDMGSHATEGPNYIPSGSKAGYNIRYGYLVYI